ncbi:MAG: bacillithiol biosynthesis deacetylase BshB1 [Bacteroidota bacterium]
MKLDVLAVGAHPDDIELSCGGTVARLVKKGYRVGVLDLTRGELGTRGSKTVRDREAQNAGRILGVAIRENLNIPDGNVEIGRKNILKVVQVYRRYRPEVLLIPHWLERHPDHEHTHTLCKQAWYYAGLAKITTRDRGKPQSRHRPKRFFHFMQWYEFVPSFIVDITETYETRLAAVEAFASQFFDPKSKHPETLVSSPGFLEMIETRAKYYGNQIGVRYGEPFYSIQSIGVRDVFDLVLASP